MKITLYKSIKYDYEIAVIGDCVDYKDDPEYAQLSNTVDVDFKMIDIDITAAKIKGIDNDIQKARAGIELLEQAKAELLAIPDMRAE